MAYDPEHIRNSARARQIYLDTFDVNKSVVKWRSAIREARTLTSSALRASRFLYDIESALIQNAAHALVFRQVLAPPMSQDQFELVCSSYSKAAEKSGRPLPPQAAKVVAKSILQRLDRGVASWPSRNAPPHRREIETFLRVASTLIGQQRISTERRSLMASEQEGAVVDLLRSEGWTCLPSKLIDMRAMVPERHFMQKTRFATATTAAQEVDIACGVRNSYVLAMECKVTNDETNSVKRINDVLKKAAAWKTHWGSFVETAAMLQGVIGTKDVQRLSDAGVHVFWSHDLETFRKWIAARS